MTAFEISSSSILCTEASSSSSSSPFTNPSEGTTTMTSTAIASAYQQQQPYQIPQQQKHSPPNRSIGEINVGPSAGVAGASQQKSTVKVGFYEVEKTIGKGNYAVVKLAKHRITKTEVAIKIIDKRRLDSENLAKIYREIEVLKSIRGHPNIVKLYQVMETVNMIYIVTEYAPNGEIFDFILKHKRLSEENAREKFWQIISAVDYLHQRQIVHRDLKAENLLLDSNFQIKLADFGFSNFFTREDTLNTFCGSPPYASPEVFDGKRYNGPEIDVWSLGVCLYVMVCGVLPFEGANLQVLRDRVLSGRIRIPYFMSMDCENLIRKMLTLDPQKRPSIEQIKRHRWMNFAQMAPKYQATAGQMFASPITPTASAFAQPPEPHPQILKLMSNLGIETTKVRNALLTDSFDNFHAIYLLLLERLKLASSGSASPPPSGGSTQQQLIPPPPSSLLSNQQQQTAQNPPSAVQQLPQNSPIQVNNPPTALLSASDAHRPRMKARRQSEGFAVLGAGTIAGVTVLPCCCCCPFKNGNSHQQGAFFHRPTTTSGTPSTESSSPRQQHHHHAPLPFPLEPKENAAQNAAQQHQQQPLLAQYAQSDYYADENCSAASSTLSRQSTIGTVGSCSIDEGVECCGETTSQSGSELSGGAVILESFEGPLLETDMFSSVCSSSSSQGPNIGGSVSSNYCVIGAVCCCGARGGCTKPGGTLLKHDALHYHHHHVHNHHLNSEKGGGGEGGGANVQGNTTSCGNPIPTFGEGWRASDNAIGAQMAGEFPTGQLGKRIRAINEINRYDQNECRKGKAIQPIHLQLRRLRISPIVKTTTSVVNNSQAQASSTVGGCPSPSSADNRKYFQMMNYLPKRISLPENLAFKPQMLLNLKQSMQVEQQLVDSGSGSGGIPQGIPSGATMDAKQALKQRLLLQQQQRMNKSRIHKLVRQQSYQSQHQKVTSGFSPTHPVTMSFVPSAVVTGSPVAMQTAGGMNQAPPHQLRVLLAPENQTGQLKQQQDKTQHMNTPLSPIGEPPTKEDLIPNNNNNQNKSSSDEDIQMDTS